MMKTPKISIITINRNNKAGLEKTCLSVVTQTMQPYEWIIIDGGSTDGSVDVINQYAEYITYWVSEQDNGIYDAMNKGVDKVTGDYVQFLNSGDSLASSGVIKYVSNEISNQWLDYYIGKEMYDDSFNKVWSPPKEITGSFLFSSFLSHQAAYISSSLLKKNHYDTSYKISADHIFAIKVFLQQNASYGPIDFIVANYDVTGISTIHSFDAIEEIMTAWRQLFGERVYEDYIRLTSGKTTLEKIICRVAKYKGLYAMLTMFALPVFAMYKIRKHFR